MRKPIVIEASEEFATKIFPTIVNLVCLILFPFWVVMTTVNLAFAEFDKKDKIAVDNV